MSTNANVRVLYATPTAPSGVTPSDPDPPLKSSPTIASLCRTCSEPVRTRKPATYCGPACRARASRGRRDSEVRAREEELRARLAHAESVLGRVAEMLAEFRADSFAVGGGRS
jgi:hypothetical protein